MKKRFKVVFKMAGGTVVKIKEFINPAGVLYCVTQNAPTGATNISIEDLEMKTMTTHKLKSRRLPQDDLDGLRAFLGGA